MNHISEITTGMIITVGTVIGLPITGWFSLSNFKEKKYIAAAAGALSFVALAAYTTRFFGTPQERLSAESFRASGPTHKYMNKKKVDQLLQANGGKIFNATFIKRDGSKRTMTCRGGVKKYVKGVGMRYNPKAYDLRVVFDLDKMQYRMIPIDRVISLRIGGTTYKAS